MSKPSNNESKPVPLASPRLSREPGRRMRSHLLDIEMGLFRARGLGGISVFERAVAAGAFPSQATEDMLELLRDEPPADTNPIPDARAVAGLKIVSRAALNQSRV